MRWKLASFVLLKVSLGLFILEEPTKDDIIGVIKHIADISSGGWSLVIAIHTFTVLFCQVQPPRWAMWLTVATVNGFMCLLCFLGPLVYNTDKYGNGDFCKLLPHQLGSISNYILGKDGISGYWCWISDEYTVGQIS